MWLVAVFRVLGRGEEGGNGSSFTGGVRHSGSVFDVEYSEDFS